MDLKINESGAVFGVLTHSFLQLPYKSVRKGRGMLIKLFSSFLLLFFSTSHNTQNAKLEEEAE